eukprot:TRINITY_DN2865_c0_g2_i1.p2 TRINITY_DN2865_c0_g2~~TRINITY_DN2865_c0_g2_i1.p2  ORF type:complete len:125 (-),score=1.51 TRINITY_DN2865_c0_g2_i1:200-574(-)
MLRKLSQHFPTKLNPKFKEDQQTRPQPNQAQEQPLNHKNKEIKRAAAADLTMPIFLWFKGCSWAWFGCGLVCWSSLNFGFNFVGKCCESFLNIHCIFSRGLQELDSKRISQIFSFLSFYLSVGF